MNEQASWKQLYKISGAILMMAGILYITLSAILVISGGSLPASGKELLDNMTEQGLLIQIAMMLFIIKDLSVLIAFPALFLTLREINKSWRFVATIFASVAMILDIISGLIVLALRSFADSYGAAPNVLKPLYLVNADLMYHYIWKVETPFMVALLSLAVIIFSLVMLKGIFSKAVPCLGIIIGAIGFIGALFGFIQPVLLLAIWYIPLGFKLYEAGKQEKHLYEAKISLGLEG